VIPGRLRDLEDYWIWLEQLLESSGGHLENDDILVVQPTSFDGGPPWLSLLVPRQRLRFYDGSYLSFLMVVGADLELLEYRFHYARPDGTIVWRRDKHSGHEAEDGGMTHIHTADGKRLPDVETNLDEVLRQIQQDQDAPPD
jgi:hypothetical protein